MSEEKFNPLTERPEVVDESVLDAVTSTLKRGVGRTAIEAAIYLGHVSFYLRYLLQLAWNAAESEKSARAYGWSKWLRRNKLADSTCGFNEKLFRWATAMGLLEGFENGAQYGAGKGWDYHSKPDAKNGIIYHQPNRPLDTPLTEDGKRRIRIAKRASFERMTPKGETETVHFPGDLTISEVYKLSSRWFKAQHEVSLPEEQQTATIRAAAFRREVLAEVRKAHAAIVSVRDQLREGLKLDDAGEIYRLAGFNPEFARITIEYLNAIGESFGKDGTNMRVRPVMTDSDRQSFFEDMSAPQCAVHIELTMADVFAESDDELEDEAEPSTGTEG